MKAEWIDISVSLRTGKVHWPGSLVQTMAAGNVFKRYSVENLEEETPELENSAIACGPHKRTAAGALQACGGKPTFV